VQSDTNFIDYAGVNESYAKFSHTIGAHHLLVALVGIAGGNPYTVTKVDDDLGNTWRRGVQGINGDETDTEIWWTISASAGPDEIDAYLVRGPGATSHFVQTLMTIAEFSGPASFNGASAAVSVGTNHGSGVIAAAKRGDIVLGFYRDPGYGAIVRINDGKTQLGTAQQVSDFVEGNQSYGSGNAVAFTTNKAIKGEVAAAAFTPSAA
jgi:hypothetical protein